MENKDFLIETKNSSYYCKDVEELKRKIIAFKVVGIDYRVIYLDEQDNPVIMQALPEVVVNGLCKTTIA